MAKTSLARKAAEGYRAWPRRRKIVAWAAVGAAGVVGAVAGGDERPAAPPAVTQTSIPEVSVAAPPPVETTEAPAPAVETTVAPTTSTAAPTTTTAPTTVRQPPARPPSTAPRAVYYPNCAAARSAGAAPVLKGQPGYGGHLDSDGDGIGCE